MWYWQCQIVCDICPRINNRTYGSRIRLKVSSNLLRTALHALKDKCQSVIELLFGDEVSVVSARYAGVMPQSFRRIQFRGVGRQVDDCPPTTVRSKPSPDVTVFMIRRIVLNPDHTTWIVASRYLFQKIQISLCVEDLVATIEETSGVYLYTTKDLDAFPLPRDRNLRLTTEPRPCSVQGGVLAEGCLVGMDQRRSLRFCVFFRLG